MPRSRPQPLVFAALAFAAHWLTPPGYAMPPGYASDTRAYNLAHGRVVFVDKCMRCHESGVRGAPVFGETSDWRERIEQPLDTLIEHAISGHGRMPARGDQDVSDQDVAAAVAYVVNRTRVIAAGEGEVLPTPAAVASVAPTDDAFDEAVLQMFRLLLGKDRWR
jgi:cytochrome c5